MRIERLHFIRYGSFDDRALDLPDAPLTVIHGPNEAGKSTALEGLGDALFGVPERSRRDWRARAAGDELRVGARLAAASGARVEFVRRKGRKRTLLDLGGATLDDDALAPFLGGCTRPLFGALYGLSQESLREEGRRMAEGQGDLGESLLAASAALRGAGRLRAALEAEAEAIFTSRRSRARTFYLAEEAFEAARRDERAATVTRRDHDAAAARVAEAEARLAEARSRVESLLEAERHDQRLSRAAPILRDLDVASSHRVDLAAFDAAPAGAADALAAALLAREAAAAEVARLEAAEAARAARAAAATSPSPLLARRDETLALAERIGDYASKLGDLPKREAELAAIEAELADRAARLGALREEFDHIAPSEPALEQGREALAEGEALSRALAEAERRLAELDAALERAPAPPPEPDPAPIGAALDRLRAAPALVAEAARAADAADRASRAVAAAEAALAPAVLDEAALRLPDADAESRVAATLAGLAERRRDLEAAAARLADDVARAAAEADETAAHHAPTREALEAAREVRDRAWSTIRRERLEAGGGDAPDPTDYEALVAAADAAADRREAEAEAIARLGAAARRLAALRGQMARLDAQRAALAAEEAAAEAAWRGLWHGLDGPPLSPPAMRDWRRAWERRLELVETAANAAVVARRLRDSAEAARAELEALGAALGVAPGASVAVTVEAVAHAVRAAEARAERRVERARLEAEHAAALANRRRAAAASQDWRRAWEDRAGRLGVDPALDIVGARRALDLWARVPDLQRERDRLRRRIDRMREDIAAFRGDAFALRGVAAADIGAADPRDVVRLLRERLREDERRASARDALAEEGARLRAASDRAVAALAASDATLAAAVAASGPAAEGVAPAALLETLRQRDALDRAIAEDRRRLAEQCGDETEAALRAALAGTNPDRLAARIAARRLDIDAANAAREEAAAALHAARASAEALRTGPDPAAARQRLRDASAAMSVAAEEWMTLRAASILLSGAARRYAAANRDPVLARAEGLFRGLTCGAFIALEAAMDETDRERLYAVRPSGERVSPEGMSEGARDQLFLALRLAAIERRAAAHEPIPFVADDLFASFDDARSEAGLAALAEIGATTQTLVFTHHRALADAAERLGAPVVSL